MTIYPYRYEPHIYIGFINVAQTPDAQLQQKENAFTACYPNGMQELPFQASAIVRISVLLILFVLVYC